MEDAVAICLNGTSAVSVSVDLYVIDPTEAPGVSVPEKDGITKREALLINSIVSGRIGEVCSYDLVELNPLRDIEGRTETTACRLLDQLLVSVKSK
jgi:arginase family enzyme